MTDYEMMSLFQEITNTTWTVFATYVSIVFAFLVAGYLVSNRLAPRIVSVVVTLYSLVALLSVISLNRASSNGMALAAEIKRAVQENDSSLSWVQISPDAVLSTLPVLITTVAIVAYAGSLIFFFHQRKFSGPNRS